MFVIPWNAAQEQEIACFAGIREADNFETQLALHLPVSRKPNGDTAYKTVSNKMRHLHNTDTHWQPMGLSLFFRNVLDQLFTRYAIYIAASFRIA